MFCGSFKKMGPVEKEKRRPASGRVSLDYNVLEALQEREQHLAESQRLAHLGSWDWDVNADRVTWSDELYRVFGLQVQELEPTYEGCLARIHPDDREDQAAQVARAVQTHEPFESLCRVITATGEVKWVFGLGEVTVDRDGNAVRLHGTAQDVTRQMASWRIRRRNEAKAANGRSSPLLDFEDDAETVLDATDAEPDECGEALRQALQDRDLVLHYQPKVLLANDRVAGFEALVRWQHPTLGLIPPDKFIPLAERTGLIVPLGAWVLEEACRQAQELQALLPDRPPLAMAVNLSARQFGPALVETVAGVLARTGIQPWRLCLELTESIIMTDVESAIEILAQLKSLGVYLSIDDFGTGYSSLAYLRRFPIDELKIDRSFVDGLGRESEDTAIVAAIVAMAHALELSVVAEGVETQEQLERLRVLGCEQVQGYYFSKPLPAPALESLLTERDGRWGAPVGENPDDHGGYHGQVVVIADDSPEVLQLAAVSLSAAGFEVHQAEDGRAAVELAQEVKPSCVVLDVRMPVMGGIEACQELRADAAMAGCTIIMLTANAGAADKVEGFSAGADDYIVKPFAPRDLVSRVRAAIRRHEGDTDRAGAV